LVCGVSVLLMVLAAANAQAQQTAPAPAVANQPGAQTPPSSATPQTADTHAPAPTAAPSYAGQAPELGSITEDELRKQLEGKDLFLRGGYLDNTLTFNEHGVLIGHSPQGSYTLAGIRIEKVRLLKHKVELEGARYALHFLGALPSEDPTTAVDRVNITPKKKAVRITIDRELVVKPKQEKGRNGPRSRPPQRRLRLPHPRPIPHPISRQIPRWAPHRIRNLPMPRRRRWRLPPRPRPSGPPTPRA
jgi:hypothetical protein